MNTNQLIKILFAIPMLALLLVIVACSDEKDEPVVNSRRTILVYMVASNSLGGNERDIQDLNEMDHAVEREGLNDCRWLVYRVGLENPTPVLFEIKKGKRGAIVHETLEEYDTTRGASVTRARMSKVIADAMRHAPADDYGLVLWSHGTGWAPSLKTRSDAPRRVFGEDNGVTMSIDELAHAIPPNIFSWIYADVCYMGAIEVAYQLRDCCRFFVGYPTEIPGRGMPYELTLPLLCADESDLIGACRETYEYYDIQTGVNRSFTGAVVDCTVLPRIAELCREIHHNAVETPSLSTIQCYNLNSDHFFYDFMQYTLAIADSTQAARLQELYGQMVLYRAATPSVFSRILINQSRFSGLSTYVLGTSPGVNEQYYKTLDWYNAVYAE